MKGSTYIPCVLVTDRLARYRAGKHEGLHSVEHRQSYYLKNRAENSHQPTRKREQVMQRFTSVDHAQRFLAAFTLRVPAIREHFCPRRHRFRARRTGETVRVERRSGMT